MFNIIFFGTTGIFSLHSFQGLIEAGIEIRSVVIPAATTHASLPRRVEPPRPAESLLSIIDPYFERNIINLAWARNIPVWEVGPLSDPPTLALLAGFQPDLIVVACFPAILPLAVLQLPRYGCLNLHPSLLPAYRGPVPLFWMARAGERQAGVTLHFMNEGIDSGDIVTQTVFDWPDGISGAELDQRCAVEGGRLLVAAVRQLDETGHLPRRPQPVADSSYFSWPADEDLVIPTDWDARRAFNFARAATEWPLVVAVGRRGGEEAKRQREIGDTRFSVRAVVAYDSRGALDQPYLACQGEIWLQFNPGVLKIKL